MNRAESDRQARDVIALRHAGLTCPEIAERLGCSVYRVWYVLRSRGEAAIGDPQERLLTAIFGKAQ